MLDNRRAPVDESRLLAALPRSEAVNTNKFASVIVCGRCHQANGTDLVDRKLRSPVTELQAPVVLASLQLAP